MPKYAHVCDDDFTLVTNLVILWLVLPLSIFTNQNGMDKNCTRLWLLELAKRGQRLLDVGITNNLKKGLKVEIVSRSIKKHPVHAHRFS